MQTLRMDTPTARKAHRCDWCYGPIEPGEKYRRSTNIYDDRLYDWIACNECDAISTDVWVWAYQPDEGIGEDSFMEWAQAHRDDPTHGDAARAYLVRRRVRPTPPADLEDGHEAWVADVLDEHFDPPGWMRSDDDRFAYECECGERMLTEPWRAVVEPPDVEDAAEWHRAHVAAILAARIAEAEAAAVREAARAVGHAEDCGMDPDRDPYIGCRCRMSLVWEYAARIARAARPNTGGAE